MALKTLLKASLPANDNISTPGRLFSVSGSPPTSKQLKFQNEKERPAFYPPPCPLSFLARTRAKKREKRNSASFRILSMGMDERGDAGLSEGFSVPGAKTKKRSLRFLPCWSMGRDRCSYASHLESCLGTVHTCLLGSRSSTTRKPGLTCIGSCPSFVSF